MEDDGIPEDDGMADSGYLESQANNMDPLMVRRESVIEPEKKQSCHTSTFTARFKSEVKAFLLCFIISSCPCCIGWGHLRRYDSDDLLQFS